MKEKDKMDIDFIKWMCEKAEGFEYKDNGVLFGEKLYPLWTSFDSDLFKYLCNRLILQSAIEGVNRECYIGNQDYSIFQDFDVIQINKDLEHVVTINIHGRECAIDKAKESALMYIYNQETK